MKIVCSRQRVNEIDPKGLHDEEFGEKAPPQNTRLGGDIYIHGHGAQSDWTWGCVALENEDIRELFDAVNVGTPVTIEP